MTLKERMTVGASRENLIPLPSISSLELALEGYMTTTFRAGRRGQDFDLFYNPLTGMVNTLCESGQKNLKIISGIVGDNPHFSENEGQSYQDLNAWYSRLRWCVDQMIGCGLMFGNVNKSESRSGIPNIVVVGDTSKWMEANIYPFTHEPNQWNLYTLTANAQWIVLMLTQKYWRGDPHYYFYIDDVHSNHFPAIPRLFRANEWATGFGGRLGVPNLKALTAEQKAAMWDDLLVKSAIYTNENIDHSVRSVVFALVARQIPETAKLHLDCCGGRGDFITFLKTTSCKIQSRLIDISPKAVAVAREMGIDAKFGNVEHSLDYDDDSFDVITLVFAMQWLQPATYSELLRKLKPGGKFICNVYPPLPEEAERLKIIFEEAGFNNIEYVLDNSWQKDVIIFSAYKPN